MVLIYYLLSILFLQFLNIIVVAFLITELNYRKINSYWREILIRTICFFVLWYLLNKIWIVNSGSISIYFILGKILYFIGYIWTLDVQPKSYDVPIMGHRASRSEKIRWATGIILGTSLFLFVFILS